MQKLTSEDEAKHLFNDLDPSSIIDVGTRKEILEDLLRITKEKAEDILAALNKDLGRHYHESCLIELFPTVGDMKHIISKINKWTKPEKVKAPAIVFPSKLHIDKVPLGRGLIIAPFNFPFFLSLPYVSTAIAAGNAVVVRPSNKTPNCDKVLADIARELDKPHIFKVVDCNHEVADMLTALPWNKIFYTGSSDVGRHIMDLASENLVPLTLELGGKSPTFVTKHCDIDLACKRVAFGKTINCGQICVAPDYVLIEHNDECPDLTNEFIREYSKHITKFYGEDVKKSPCFSRMISTASAERIKKMIKEAEEAESSRVSGVSDKMSEKSNKGSSKRESVQGECCGTKHCGGQTLCLSKETKVLLGNSDECDPERRYIPPTIILNPTMEMQCMKEEIFGPVLVVIEVASLKDMLKFVARRPNPLALYAFTDDKEEMELIRRETRSGDLIFNDVVLHCMLSEAPFGGVGNSGMGVAHGYHAFLSWCTLRTTMERNAHGGLSQVDKFFRYAPYEETYQKSLGVISAGWSFDWKDVDPEGGAGVGADAGAAGEGSESAEAE